MSLPSSSITPSPSGTETSSTTVGADGATTTLRYFDPGPQPGGGKALKIALPTVFGIVLVSIVTIFIMTWIRRRRSKSATGSVEEGEEQREQEPVQSSPGRDSDENYAKVVPRRPMVVQAEGAEAEKQPEQEVTETPRSRERPSSIPSSPVVSPRTSHRHSHRHSHRRASEIIPDQFEDHPKPHRKGSKRPSVVLEKMPPP